MIDLSRERPLSVMQAAHFLNVPPQVIKRWFRAGMESVRIGGRVYTTREAIQRFAEPATADAADVAGRHVQTTLAAAESQWSSAIVAAMNSVPVSS